jgi:RES domain-containing protein
VNLWRIAAETRKYAADDMSGAGAALSPGRWNEEFQPVVYTAPTIAMVVLETAAHIDSAGIPLNRFLVRIEVPERVWSARETVDVASLPPTWAAVPAGSASARFGSRWLTEARSAILLVPSVIVPEEVIALVNPLHADADEFAATVIRRFEYNLLYRAL